MEYGMFNREILDKNSCFLSEWIRNLALVLLWSIWNVFVRLHIIFGAISETDIDNIT